MAEEAQNLPISLAIYISMIIAHKRGKYNGVIDKQYATMAV